MAQRLSLKEPETMWAIVYQVRNYARVVTGTISHTRSGAISLFGSKNWKRHSIKNGGVYDCIKVSVDNDF